MPGSPTPWRPETLSDEARRRGAEVDAGKPAGAGKAFLIGGGMNCMFARYDDAEFQI